MLAGKVAVVTGGGGGIGSGISKLMAVEGAKVVVADFGRAAADKTVAEIKAARGAAVASYENIGTMDGAAKTIHAAIDNFGSIDILVNVAGNAMRKDIVELTEADWDNVMSVHIKGHFACSKAAIPHMLKQKSGRIINFASRAAFWGNNLSYATAKAGIMGFTACLARNMKGKGITVNAILPSAVTQSWPGKRSSSGDQMPHYDLPAAEDVAPMVCYLATDDAKDISGRFFYASAGDFCLYTFPLKLSAANVFVRKIGKWNVDELGDVIKPLLDVGSASNT